MCQKPFKHFTNINLIMAILNRYYFPPFFSDLGRLGNFYKIKKIWSSGSWIKIDAQLFSKYLLLNDIIILYKLKNMMVSIKYLEHTVG